MRNNSILIFTQYFNFDFRRKTVNQSPFPYVLKSSTMVEVIVNLDVYSRASLQVS